VKQETPSSSLRVRARARRACPEKLPFSTAPSWAPNPKLVSSTRETILETFASCGAVSPSGFSAAEPDWMAPKPPLKAAAKASALATNKEPASSSKTKTDSARSEQKGAKPSSAGAAKALKPPPAEAAKAAPKAKAEESKAAPKAKAEDPKSKEKEKKKVKKANGKDSARESPVSEELTAVEESTAVEEPGAAEVSLEAIPESAEEPMAEEPAAEEVAAPEPPPPEPEPEPEPEPTPPPEPPAPEPEPEPTPPPAAPEPEAPTEPEPEPVAPEPEPEQSQEMAVPEEMSAAEEEVSAAPDPEELPMDSLTLFDEFIDKTEIAEHDLATREQRAPTSSTPMAFGPYEVVIEMTDDDPESLQLRVQVVGASASAPTAEEVEVAP